VEEAPASALHLWWLGQSGFLVKLDDRYLLLDPYLSDSLTEKYEGTPTPHVRMTRRVVDPARLAFVDVVTASHGHTDHLDPLTLRGSRTRRERDSPFLATSRCSSSTRRLRTTSSRRARGSGSRAGSCAPVSV